MKKQQQPASGDKQQQPAGSGGQNQEEGKNQGDKEEEKEQQAKQEEEEPISLGGPQKKKKKLNSFYDPPLPKPEEKFNTETKRLNELVRRWKVHIYQIELVNLLNASTDPFLQITIGGDFHIEIKKTAGGATLHIPHGTRGITYQTEVLRLVEPNEQGRMFALEIETEYRGSYFELMQQRLHVEVWSRQGSSNLFLNTFTGYASIPLLDIVSGSFKQTLPIMPFGGDSMVQQKQTATVSFQVRFEEVWDFCINFIDWKTTSLEKHKDKQMQMNPMLQLKLLSSQALQSTVYSPVAKNTKLPHWALFDEGIRYRGTYSELKSERLQITLYNQQLLVNTVLGTKTVPLSQCLDLAFLKTDMVIHKPKKRTEENIRGKAQTCQVQGALRVGQRPKYSQQGDLEQIIKHEQYLAVQVQRLAVFDSLDDQGGEVSVFATIEWGGVQKRSRAVRRPNLNEILLFHLPIEQDVREDHARLSEYLNDELETKSELLINVWADNGGGRGLENLGAARLCLGQLHYQRFEDKQYQDERTKQKISYQCRVYTTTLKLQSAFYDTSNSSVALSVWFQPEVPYPSVDLSRLKPREEDVYPSLDIEQNLKSGNYQAKFNQVLQRNFPPEYPVDDRRFECLFYSDQHKQKHLLPLFLSKITPPDSNFITFESSSESQEVSTYGNNSERQRTKQLTRGIRTLAEVAHFVRCLPFRSSHELYQRDRVWSSPDFLLTMRVGSVEEHALLLASMFRAVKYETTEDIIREQLAKGLTANSRRGHKRALLAAGEDIIDGEKGATSSLCDRVFTCLGKTRESATDTAWVMTLSRSFDEVTMWEPSTGRCFQLPGRVSEEEAINLQGYLSPNISEEEKKQIMEHRELKRQESSWYHQSDLHQSEMEFEDAEDQQNQSLVSKRGGRRGVYAGNLQGSEITDDEKESEDSSFMENLNQIVHYDDLDQKYKGATKIELIGKIKGLSRERQEHLKDLDYFSDDQEDTLGKKMQNRQQDFNRKEKRKPNKFLENQDKERLEREKQRLDKHLLPIDQFYDQKTGKTIPSQQLPFASTVDLIFNHKQIWANLQNQNPGCILYNLHDETKWLPLIADPAIPHTLLLEQARQQQPPAQQEEQGKTKKKKGNGEGRSALLECRVRGDYMKPFTSFYDPKGLEPPLSQQQVQRYEQLILKELEIAIKQVRSSKNLSTKIRRSAATVAVLRRQLDYLEDVDCQRIPKEKQEEHRINVERELLKLVPESYRLALLPAQFTYTDAERIRTVIADRAQDFLLNKAAGASVNKHAKEAVGNKKVMFAIGVKIYPFHNQVCSVRLAIVRMTPLEAREAEKHNQTSQPTQTNNTVVTKVTTAPNKPTAPTKKQ